MRFYLWKIFERQRVDEWLPPPISFSSNVYWLSCFLYFKSSCVIQFLLPVHFVYIPSLSLCDSPYFLSFSSDSQGAEQQVPGICCSAQEISFGRPLLLEEAPILVDSSILQPQDIGLVIFGIMYITIMCIQLLVYSWSFDIYDWYSGNILLASGCCF